MSQRLLTEDIRHFLRTLGGVEQTPGVAGALWNLGAATIAVADEILPDSLEWRSVVDRVSRFLDVPVTEVERRIKDQYIDVARLRAAKDTVIEGSIPLDAGVKLVTSAKTMLRASATTAQRVRSQISGAYSVTGDRIVETARLGHTIHGSYIIPILMPLPRPTDDSETRPTFDSLSVHKVAYEPAERRVMRTFAEALNAVEQVVVRPGNQPIARDMPELVAAGASREFINGLLEIVDASAVSTFSATFNWASSAKSPTVPTSIEVPHEASELLKMASKLLLSSKPPALQTVTGLIVEVRHIPDDPFGHASVQTTRNGRPSEIRVTLRIDQLDKAHDWMRSSRTVVVDGKVVRQPGQPLRIDVPARFGPLDESYLFSD